MGKKFDIDDIEFIDFILENINHVYVRMAIETLYEDIEPIWNNYVNAINLITNLPNKWNWIIDRSDDHNDPTLHEKIFQEYSGTLFWIETFTDKLYEWLDENLQGITKPSPKGFLALWELEFEN